MQKLLMQSDSQVADVSTVVVQHSKEQQQFSNHDMLRGYVSNKDMLAEGMLEQQHGQACQSRTAVSHKNMFISPARHLAR